MRKPLDFDHLLVDTIAITVLDSHPPEGLEQVGRWDNRLQGVVDNLKVRYYFGNRKLQIRGSLPIFFNGTNFKALTLDEQRKAICCLADRFCIDPFFARIFQVDLSATMNMPRPVCQYLQLLEAPSRMKTTVYPGESITFYHTQRSVGFYDKGKESKIEGHYLRLEVKIKKRLKDVAGLSLTLSDLGDENVFDTLVNTWENEYFKLEKRPGYILAEDTPRIVERQLAGIGLQTVGEANVLAQIDSWNVTPGIRYRLKRSLKELGRKGNLPHGLELIEELDEAVQQMSRHLKAHV